MLTGLVVGKFSPLHAGHQALIEFARVRCDRLVILSYSKPELPGCPADRRAEWLEALFPDAIRLVLDDDRVAVFARRRGERPRPVPDNDASDHDQRAFVGWVCRALLGVAVDRLDAKVERLEGKLDGFRDSVDDRFDQVLELIKQSFRTLHQEIDALKRG